jgi:hypothetical protein
VLLCWVLDKNAGGVLPIVIGAGRLKKCPQFSGWSGSAWSVSWILERYGQVGGWAKSDLALNNKTGGAIAYKQTHSKASSYQRTQACKCSLFNLKSQSERMNSFMWGIVNIRGWPRQTGGYFSFPERRMATKPVLFLSMLSG